MGRNRLAVLAATLLAAAILPAGGARAQSLDDKLRAQLRTVMGQLHDLQNGQAALQAQVVAAEQERDALKARLAQGGGARAATASPALQAELERARADNARLTQANQDAQAEIARYKDAYIHVVESAQQVHGERDRFAQETAAATQKLAVCETKNIQLVKISRDVLAAYSKIGVGEAMARGEPFIGLKRVKMERIAQEYGDKVYEAKFDPRAVKAPAATSATPAAAPPTTP